MLLQRNHGSRAGTPVELNTASEAGGRALGRWALSGTGLESGADRNVAHSATHGNAPSSAATMSYRASRAALRMNEATA
jgi:hypothetical protein